MSVKYAYVVVKFKGLLDFSSSPAASNQDGKVELLRLQPLLLQHVPAKHVQSLLQLPDSKNSNYAQRPTKNTHDGSNECANLVLLDQFFAL